MKTFLAACLSLFLLWQASFCATPSLIIKLRPDIERTQFIADIQVSGIRKAEPFLPSLLSKQSLQIQAQQPPSFAVLQRYIVLTLEEGSDTTAILEKLRLRGDIETAETNHLHSIEKTENSPEQENIKAQWALHTIQAEQAWQKATGKGVIIGVIDTGVDFTHPDLAHQIHINAAEDINGNGKFDPWPASEKVDGVSGDLDGIDNDGNGYTDDVIGYDFVDQTLVNFGDAANRDPIPSDENGHGTNVAGVLAAEHGNDIGVSGLAYNSKLLVLRAFDATGNAEDDDIAAAVVYGALNGARVLNMSFGDIYFPPILQDALKFAYDSGCVLVSSSGNAGGTGRHFPSNFPEVITVGATTKTDRLTDFSTRGSQLIMVAPGQDILTTKVNASYGSASGTSFSSPYVAAAAALILELHPEYKPEEVRGVLQTSADDLGDKGWDITFGAGRLNAARAVNSVGATDIHIDSPDIDEAFNRDHISQIVVTGSIATPFFASFRVEYGPGENPSAWAEASPVTDTQRLHDTLGLIPSASLDDGTYVVRLQVLETDGMTIERRIRFSIVSGKPVFTQLTNTLAWFDQRRVLVFSARTDRPTRFYLRLQSGQNIQGLTDMNHFTYNHTIVVDNEMQFNTQYTIAAFAVSSDGDTSAFQSFEHIVRNPEAMPQTNFLRKKYSLPSSYLLDTVSNFYGDGRATVFVSDYSTGVFGPAKSYQFQNGTFTARDSSQTVWLPRGIGDSNGDGIPEVFCFSGSSAILFQGSSPSASPFSGVLLDRSSSLNFWATGMGDLDHDGKPELITHNDSDYVAYSYRNGQYTAVGTANNPSTPDYDETGNTLKSSNSILGDFDNDGVTDLCFTDDDADVLFFGYNNGQFQQEYIDENTGKTEADLITSLDVDGDGKPEILVGRYNRVTPNADREYDTPMWTFKILKSDAPHHFVTLWEEHFYGARPTSPYRSGVARGELNGVSGDEVIIAAFPNLYIFTWDKASQSMQPLWYYPTALANTALVYDFDGNGRREIGFNTGNSVQFFELDPATTNRPRGITGLEGHAVSSSSVVVRWNASPDAESYRVYSATTGSTSLSLAGTTSETQMIVGGLNNATTYIFGVTALDGSGTESDLSEIIEVYVHDPITPDSIKVQTRRTLAVYFSGDIPQSALQPSLFAIQGFGIPSTVIWQGNNTALLQFPIPLPSGSQELSIASFHDRFNTPTIAKTLSFTVEAEPYIPELYLTKLHFINPHQWELEYSEPVDPASATNTAFYLFRPIGTVEQVGYDPDRPNTVVLTISSDAPVGPIGRDFTVTVTNVVAQSGHLMTKGAGNTLGYRNSATGLDDVYAYPNPVHLSESSTVVFGNLTAQAEVTIRRVSGEIIATVTEKDGNGGVEWDCHTSKGELLGSGVYLFSVTGTNEAGEKKESPLKKFVIIRQ